MVLARGGTGSVFTEPGQIRVFSKFQNRAGSGQIFAFRRKIRYQPVQQTINTVFLPLKVEMACDFQKLIDGSP